MKKENALTSIIIDKKFVCPIVAGANADEAECKYVNDFYCRYASLAHLRVANEKDLLNCPYDLDPEGNFD